MNAKDIVLFIDDDKHLARIIKDFLTHEGYEAHIASSAEEGLHCLGTLTPDLIVLDISMPGMGGIGFLKRISNADGSLKYPVLVLTARAVMQEFFNTVSVDGFLPKPCSELDLIRKIREIIAQVTNKKDTRDQAESRAQALCKVIIGEDDETMRLVYLRMFRECNFDVHLAANGPEVLEQAVAIHPDAIVMKEILPNMNGSVVARLIKTLPGTKHIPVIVHDTGRTSRPTNDNNQAVDMFLFSSMAHDLIAAVREALA